MPANSSWMPYAPQGVTGLDDDSVNRYFSKEKPPVGLRNRMHDVCTCDGTLILKHHADELLDDKESCSTPGRRRALFFTPQQPHGL